MVLKPVPSGTIQAGFISVPCGQDEHTRQDLFFRNPKQGFFWLSRL